MSGKEDEGSLLKLKKKKIIFGLWLTKDCGGVKGKNVSVGFVLYGR